MRRASFLAAALGSAALVVATAGTASAGEITGTGQWTPPHFYNAHSICSFSGLQDGDGGPIPGPGNAPPQNWGHDKGAFGATPAERKASGFQPGDACNGHRGFLAGGGGEGP